MPSEKTPPALEFHPLTTERWQDLEMLFDKNGACGGCWCMYWRLKRSEFYRQAGQGNKEAFKSMVDSGEIPGILAYAHGNAVGWCSVAPRENYGALERSRTLKRVDEQPVWSVVCFFTAKPYRGQGLMQRLLETAVEYARGHGAEIIEGYPVEPRKTKVPDLYLYTGVVSVFHNAGFTEVLRRSETRPIMRYFVKEL
ncbi:MAG: GNAT family N-acetyltransferase [Chloroflexi bacterium]|nr:GNAT family N-acetyltransferase [Chloroflexota bacterium]